MRRWRVSGVGVIATAVVCPCHVLAGLASLVVGSAVLSPAAQDGIHAVYAPLAVIIGAVLFRARGAGSNRSRAAKTG